MIHLRPLYNVYPAFGEEILAAVTLPAAPGNPPSSRLNVAHLDVKL
jgi:hypothetical protein